MRLAERQGLLTGRSLSRVQQRALQMLMAIEDRQRAHSFVDSLRVALVGAHPGSLPQVFPEWFPKESREREAFEKARRPDGTYDPDLIDDSKLPASIPSTEEEKQAVEDVMNELGVGLVSPQELEGGDTEWH